MAGRADLIEGMLAPDLFQARPMLVGIPSARYLTVATRALLFAKMRLPATR